MGNLPFSTTSDELATLFGRVGAVTSAQVITDRETGRSRGFGFVEMSDEDARKAIDELTGADFNGRSITVNEARPRAPRGRAAARQRPPVLTSPPAFCPSTSGPFGPIAADRTDQPSHTGFVIAPVSAPCTSRAYLASTPLV